MTNIIISKDVQTALNVNEQQLSKETLNEILEDKLLDLDELFMVAYKSLNIDLLKELKELYELSNYSPPE